MSPAALPGKNAAETALAPTRSKAASTFQCHRIRSTSPAIEHHASETKLADSSESLTAFDTAVGPECQNRIEDFANAKHTVLNRCASTGKESACLSTEFPGVTPSPSRGDRCISTGLVLVVCYFQSGVHEERKDELGTFFDFFASKGRGCPLLPEVHPSMKPQKLRTRSASQQKRIRSRLRAKHGERRRLIGSPSRRSSLFVPWPRQVRIPAVMTDFAVI